MTDPSGQFIPATPSFEPPGLSIRAIFLASDGSRPQEIILEWKHDPGQAILEFALDKITELARPSEVHIVTQQQGEMQESIAGGPAMPASLIGVLCRATGAGHEDEGHWCILDQGHRPIEPDGRAHRCRCGGIFAADAEVPDVPGRREQERRRERE